MQVSLIWLSLLLSFIFVFFKADKKIQVVDNQLTNDFYLRKKALRPKLNSSANIQIKANVTSSKSNNYSPKSTIKAFGLAVGNWSFINNGANCPASLPSECMQGKHEAAFVQVGDKFYLVGGRENSSNVNIYNPTTDTWSIGATPPLLLHHFQAINYDGLIYVVAGFTGNFPSEPPLTHIYIYNPLKNNWLQGPAIPTARRRGSAGVVIHNNKIYVVSGNILGHKGQTPSGDPTHVRWFDEFDPVTNTWTALPDAPRARDHFQVAVINNRLYAVAGRRSNHSTATPQQTFANTEANVDVYDFNTGSWATLANDLPTLRAGNAVAVLGNELLVIGGESLSQSAAHNQNEALNVNDGTWRTLDPLQVGRHGTQAIVNNGGVYIAAGSPNRGGGNTFSQEVFFLGASTSPILTPITAGNLNPSLSSVNFGQVLSGQTKQQTITLNNQNGNQGIIVRDIDIQSGSHPDFELSIPFTMPIHIRPGGSLSFTARVNSTSNANKSASINIQHSGGNANVNIALSTQDTPLAVGLMRFDVQRVNENQVRLVWETAWEQENKGFEIERSEDAIHFQKIGFVDGGGNQMNRKVYQFTDNQAFTNVYYRLKQLDWSGIFNYSMIKFVAGNEKEFLYIYPNPTSGQITWQSSLRYSPNEKVIWQLTDNQGFVISEGQSDMEAMKQQIEAKIKGSTSQVLYLRLVIQQKIFTQKIIKN
jgi:hypothetical protein